MLIARVARAPRVIAAALLATVALPLGLCSCANVQPSAAPASELRAAQDSDLLAEPTDRRFELNQFEITAPHALAALTSVAQAQVKSWGFIVVNADVITAAEIDFDVANMQHAGFVLTQPTALRRAEGETDPIYAVGELVVGDSAPQPATVKFTPTTLAENAVEFEVFFELPVEFSFPSERVLPNEITATILLTTPSS